jgi:hypothetical protein
MTFLSKILFISVLNLLAGYIYRCPPKTLCMPLADGQLGRVQTKILISSAIHVPYHSRFGEFLRLWPDFLEWGGGWLTPSGEWRISLSREMR